jgi:hypothetical protein
VSAVLAIVLVALHLVTALHFTLVQHKFCAESGGFVHLKASALMGARRTLDAPAARGTDANAVATETASCEAEHCPLGFAGNSVVLAARDGVVETLTLVYVEPHPLLRRPAAEQARVLLSAPKTSPPCLKTTQPQAFATA